MKLESCWCNCEEKPSEIMLTFKQHGHEEMVNFTPDQVRWLIANLPIALVKLKAERAKRSGK